MGGGVISVKLDPDNLISSGIVLYFKSHQPNHQGGTPTHQVPLVLRRVELQHFQILRVELSLNALESHATVGKFHCYKGWLRSICFPARGG